MYDKEFCVPSQKISEESARDDVRSRFARVVDGKVMDSTRVKYLTKDSILSKEYGSQITGLNNWIDAYKGQIDNLRNELAVTKYQLEQARQPTTLGKLSKKLESGTTSLRGASGRLLASEIGRRIRRRIGMLIARSPTS
jgi:hypothetical protein